MSLTRLDDALSIATHVHNCLEGFHGVCNVINKTDSTIRNKIPPGAIHDALGRFRLWVGNIGAHRKGRASLDYKLREASHIRDRVIELLRSLESVLQEALEIVTGERVPWEDLSDSESDISEGPGPPDDEIPTTELAQLASNMTEINSCLMRLSLAIRNPAPHDQFKQSSQIDVKHFEAFDIDHVRGKFPFASEYLVLRLGKAISRRRQYLRYREEHRKKLEQGLPSQPLPQEVESAQEVTRTIIAPSEKIDSTVASSIPLEIKTSTSTSNVDEIDYYEDTLSQTSYASSSNDSSKLRPPPLPEAGQDGEPFECPLCFRFTSVRQTPAWHKHVYRDLQPYVCTFDGCEIPDRTYESRHEWFQHEIHAHRKWWECIEGCNMNFHSLDNFQGHLASDHSDLAATSRTSDLVRNCERQDPMDASANCPLCRVNLPSLTQLRRHLGKHHEELSLFALPSHMKEDENEDDDDGVDDGSRSSIAGSDTSITMEANPLYNKARQLLRERPSIVEAMDAHILDPTLLDDAARTSKPDDVNTWAQYKRWLEDAAKLEDVPIDLQHVHVLQAIMFHIILVTQETDEYFQSLIELHKNVGNNAFEEMSFPIDGRSVTLYQIVKAMFSHGGVDELDQSQDWADLGYHLGWNEILTSDGVQAMKRIHQHYVVPYRAAYRDSTEDDSSATSRVDLHILFNHQLDYAVCELLGVSRSTTVRNLRGLILNAKPELEAPERMTLSFEDRILWHSDTLDSILSHETEASIRVDFAESSPVEVPLPGLVDMATELPDIEIHVPGTLVITHDRWLYLPLSSTNQCFHVNLYSIYDLEIIAPHRIELQVSLQELKFGSWATLQNLKVFFDFRDKGDFRAACEHVRRKMSQKLPNPQKSLHEDYAKSVHLPTSTIGESYNIRVITGTLVSKKVPATIQILDGKLIIEVTPQLRWSLGNSVSGKDPYGADKARLPPKNNQIEIREMKNEDTGEIEDVIFKAVPGETPQIWGMIQRFLFGEQAEDAISISESTSSDETSVTGMLQQKVTAQPSRDEPAMNPHSLPALTNGESYGIGVLRGTPVMKLPATIQVVDETLIVEAMGQITWQLEPVKIGDSLDRLSQAHLYPHNDHFQMLGLMNKSTGAREDVLFIAQVHEEAPRIWAMIRRFLKIEQADEATSRSEESTTVELSKNVDKDTHGFDEHSPLLEHDLVEEPTQSKTPIHGDEESNLQRPLASSSSDTRYVGQIRTDMPDPRSEIQDPIPVLTAIPDSGPPTRMIVRFENFALSFEALQTDGQTRYWYCLFESSHCEIGLPTRSEAGSLISVSVILHEGPPDAHMRPDTIKHDLRLRVLHDSNAGHLMRGLMACRERIAEIRRQHSVDSVEMSAAPGNATDSEFEAFHSSLSSVNEVEATIQHYTVKVIGLPEGQWTRNAGMIVDVQLKRRMMCFIPAAQSPYELVMYYNHMEDVVMGHKEINVLGDVYYPTGLPNNKEHVNSGAIRILLQSDVEADIVAIYQHLAKERAALGMAAPSGHGTNSVDDSVMEKGEEDEPELTPALRLQQEIEEDNALEKDTGDSDSDAEVKLYARGYIAEGDMTQCDPSRCIYAWFETSPDGIEFVPDFDDANKELLGWRYLEYLERADLAPHGYLALIFGRLGKTLFLIMSRENADSMLESVHRYRPEARVTIRPLPPTVQSKDEQPESFYHWTVPQLQDFENNLAYFGTDWSAMAAHMGNKTEGMLKQRYTLMIDRGHADLERTAKQADARRMRGENLGLPPVPLPQELHSEKGPDTNEKAPDGVVDVQEDVQIPVEVHNAGESDDSFDNSRYKRRTRGYIHRGGLADYDQSRVAPAILDISKDHIKFTPHSRVDFTVPPMPYVLEWSSLNWMGRGGISLAIVTTGSTVFITDKGEGVIDRIENAIWCHRPTLPCVPIWDDEMPVQDVVGSVPGQEEAPEEAPQTTETHEGPDKTVSTETDAIKENEDSDDESEESYSELLAKHQAFDDYPPLSETVARAGDPTLPGGYFDMLYQETATPDYPRRPMPDVVDNEFATFMDEEYFWIPSSSQHIANAYDVGKKWTLLCAVREKKRRRGGGTQDEMPPKPSAVQNKPSTINFASVQPAQDDEVHHQQSDIETRSTTNDGSEPRDAELPRSEQATVIQRPHLTISHTDQLLAAQIEYARKYSANGQMKQAIVLLEHVVKVYEKTLSEDHPSRLAAQAELAVAYSSNRQEKEGIALLEHVVKVHQKTLSEKHPNRLAAQVNLASMYSANGQIKEAIALLKDMVEAHKTTLGENPRGRQAAQEALADAYSSNGEIDEAITLLEQLVKSQEVTEGWEDTSHLRLLRKLAIAYQFAGQKSEAAQLQQQILLKQSIVDDSVKSEELVSELRSSDADQRSERTTKGPSEQISDISHSRNRIMNTAQNLPTTSEETLPAQSGITQAGRLRVGSGIETFKMSAPDTINISCTWKNWTFDVLLALYKDYQAFLLDLSLELDSHNVQNDLSTASIEFKTLVDGKQNSIFLIPAPTVSKADWEGAKAWLKDHEGLQIQCIIQDQHEADVASATKAGTHSEVPNKEGGENDQTTAQPKTSERIQLRCAWAQLVVNIWLEMDIPCQAFRNALKALLNSRGAKVEFSAAFLEFKSLEMRTDYQKPQETYILYLTQGSMEARWDHCVEWLRANKRAEAPHMSADLRHAEVESFSTKIVVDNPLEYEDFDPAPSKRAQVQSLPRKIVDDNPMAYEDFNPAPSKRVTSDEKTTEEVQADRRSEAATIRDDNGMEDSSAEDSDISDFDKSPRKRAPPKVPRPVSGKPVEKKTGYPDWYASNSYSEDDATHARAPDMIRLECNWKDQIFKMWLQLNLKNINAFRHALADGLYHSKISLPDNPDRTPRATFLEVQTHKDPLAAGFRSFTLCFTFERYEADWDKFVEWAQANKAAKAPHFYAELTVREVPSWRRARDESPKDEGPDAESGQAATRSDLVGVPVEKRQETVHGDREDNILPADNSSYENIHIELTWRRKTFQGKFDCSNGWQTFLKELEMFLRTRVFNFDLRNASLDFRTHEEGPCGTYPLSLAQKDLQLDWNHFIQWLGEIERAEEPHVYAILRDASTSSPERVLHDVEAGGTIEVPREQLSPYEEEHDTEAKTSTRGTIESARIRMKLKWEDIEFFVWLDLNASSEAAFNSINDKLFRRKVRIDRNATTIRLSTSPEFSHDESWVVFLEQFYLEADWEQTVQWLRANRRAHAPHIYGQIEMMNEPAAETSETTGAEITRRKTTTQEGSSDDDQVRTTGVDQIYVRCTWKSSTFDILFPLSDSPQAMIAAFGSRNSTLLNFINISRAMLRFTSERGNRETTLSLPLEANRLQPVWKEVVTWLKNNTRAERTHVSMVQYHISASIYEQQETGKGQQARPIPTRTYWSMSKTGKPKLVTVTLSPEDEPSKILSIADYQGDIQDKATEETSLSTDQSLENFPKPMAIRPATMERERKTKSDETLEQTDTRGYHMRIYRADDTFVTISATLDTTVADIVEGSRARFYPRDEYEQYGIIFNDDHAARRLEDDEKPLMIQKRLLENAGYKTYQQITDVASENIRHLCEFTFLPMESVQSLTRPPVGRASLKGKERVSTPPDLATDLGKIIDPPNRDLLPPSTGDNRQEGHWKLSDFRIAEVVRPEGGATKSVSEEVSSTPQIPTGHATSKVGRDQIELWEDATQQVAFANIARKLTSEQAPESDKDTNEVTLLGDRPSKANNYFGFCRGAWIIREDPRKGLRLRTLPSGMYNTQEVWECTSCSFKGSSFSTPHPTKKNRTITVVDPRVHTSESSRIRYKWIFLAKSHVKKKANDVEDSAYCCMFCSFDGRVSSVYGGETLMYHIESKHGGGMSDIAKQKAGCISGRLARDDEEWDINILD